MSSMAQGEAVMTRHFNLGIIALVAFLLVTPVAEAKKGSGGKWKGPPPHGNAWGHYKNGWPGYWYGGYPYGYNAPPVDYRGPAPAFAPAYVPPMPPPPMEVIPPPPPVAY